jgi:hypothetical protein
MCPYVGTQPPQLSVPLAVNPEDSFDEDNVYPKVAPAPLLIETWIMRWTLFMGPNQSFGEFILEECRRMMRCQGWFMRCMTLSNYISNSM